MPKRQVRLIYERLKRFYFVHNDDTERESAFLSRLGEAD
jgi:hypothetical protein